MCDLLSDPAKGKKEKKERSPHISSLQTFLLRDEKCLSFQTTEVDDRPAMFLDYGTQHS